MLAKCFERRARNSAEQHKLQACPGGSGYGAVRVPVLPRKDRLAGAVAGRADGDQVQQRLADGQRPSARRVFRGLLGLAPRRAFHFSSHFPFRGFAREKSHVE